MADENDHPTSEEQAQPAGEGALEAASQTDAPAEAEAPSDGERAPAEAQAEASAEAEEPGRAEEPAAARPEEPAEAEAEAAPASADQPEAPAEPGVPRPPADELSPKQRRRLARSRHAGEARSPRSPEERHAERLAERRVKAARRRARRGQERAKAAARPADERQAQPVPVHARAQGKRKVRQGVVVSDKAAKTIVVRIDVARRHRRYEKIVRSSGTLHAHDENNDAREGDVVRVIESRPLSRTKRWRLVEVLERAQ
jgi:small subunit ribosomal protein S17